MNPMQWSQILLLWSQVVHCETGLEGEVDLEDERGCIQRVREQEAGG